MKKGKVHYCYTCGAPLVRLKRDVSPEELMSSDQVEFLPIGGKSWSWGSGDKMICPVCQGPAAVGLRISEKDGP